MTFFFLLSLALLGFWVGWRARYCRIFIFFTDTEFWVPLFFLPALAFMVWLALFIFALGKGWV